MISNYTEKEYLQARRRQERIADKIDAGGYANEKVIKSFLRCEERLQAYEFVNIFSEDDAFIRVEIEEVLLFKICLLARRARLTVDEYIEIKLEESLERYENTVRQ